MSKEKNPTMIKLDGTESLPMGRPALDITEEMVYRHALEGLTYRSIASLLGCSPSHIEKSFSATVKRGHADLGKNIRQRLVERALGEDDKTCQIYLDKRFNKDVEEEIQLSVELPNKINLKKISDE